MPPFSRGATLDQVFPRLEIRMLEIRIQQHPEHACRIHHRGRTEGMLAEPQYSPCNEIIVHEQPFLMNIRRSLATEHVPEHCGKSTDEHELKESECENFDRNGRHGILHRFSRSGDILPTSAAWTFFSCASFRRCRREQ